MRDVKRAVAIILARLLQVVVDVCQAVGHRTQRAVGCLIAYVEAGR